MFALAILIGIYSYLILALGLLGILYKPIVILLTTVYILTTVYYYRKQIKMNFLRSFETFKEIHKSPVNLIKRNLLLTILLSMLLSQGIVNLIGALGPELGFDALWYHLTIPKLYLDNQSIFFIPGGLLYYSAMPKLTEMFYITVLAFDSEVLAKFIHFSFGLLSLIALYKLSRIFFTPKISLVAVVIFYSNLVVAWQSTTAYVDLARTFFEIMAFWGFFNYWKKGERKWLVESAVMLGLAISTKLLAIGSLFIFSSLIVIHFFLFLKTPPRRSPFGHLQGVSNKLFVYWVICLLIALPWFVFSYIHTGNPIYPFFTDIYKVGFGIELLNPFKFIREVLAMFIESSDPISPIYVISLPLIIIFFKKFTPDVKLLTIYSFLAIIVWYITPRTGGGRFLLPYLPIFSIVIAAVIEKTKDKSLRVVLISVIIIVSTISVLYRGAANVKYIPVILGIQTKNDFLSKNLNFSFGDFYDADSYFKKHIKSKDTILLYGFHNLYYAEFPFIDSSWVKRGDSFNYVAVQNTTLPKRFKDWDLVYQNLQTHVKLYSKGGIKWTY